MKKCYLLAALVVVWAAVATAQIDPGANGMGIYADLEGLTNEVEVEAGTPMEVYLLLTRPTGTRALGGWECSLVVPDNIIVWGWNHPHPETLTVGDPPDFMSVFAPIPYQDANLLMTFIIVPQDDQPAQFYIEAYAGPGGGEMPRYLDAVYEPAHDTEIIDANPYPGPDEAAFVINGGSVPEVETSWSEVKALYK